MGSFGSHFAAIAGAGPLVVPVLAARFGFLPGFIRIPVGAVFAAAVLDIVIDKDVAILERITFFLPSTASGKKLKFELFI